MILDDIVAKKKIRVEERKNQIPLEEIKKQALAKCELEREYNSELKNSFKEALAKPGLSVIGEFKKASPSKGVIVENFDIKEILHYYNNLGIDAFSILTEEDFFLGHDSYVKEISKVSQTPILRKDFVIDFYQIYEAKVLGASGILFIAAVLGKRLGEFYEEAKKFNLQPLVETHNEEELDLALKYNCDVIGINNRNLKNFNVSLDTTKMLIDKVPDDKIVVAESGMMSINDLKRMKNFGADAVLVGEMFMRNIDNKEFKEDFRNFKSL